MSCYTWGVSCTLTYCLYKNNKDESLFIVYLECCCSRAEFLPSIHLFVLQSLRMRRLAPCCVLPWKTAPCLGMTAPMASNKTKMDVCSASASVVSSLSFTWCWPQRVKDLRIRGAVQTFNMMHFSDMLLLAVLHLNVGHTTLDLCLFPHRCQTN